MTRRMVYPVKSIGGRTMELREIVGRFAASVSCAVALSQAASYHVSPGGDDNRTASQAQDASTPWKTLAKVGAYSFVPGDSILLDRGGIWRETLRLKRSGTIASPIVISSYGAGAGMPSILGTDSVMGTQVGGIWQTKTSAPVDALFLDGVSLPLARYPDTGWVVSSSVEGDSAVSAPELAGKDWVGASILLRTQMWTLEVHRVARQTGGRLVLDGPAIYSPPDSVRFFLSNHPSALGTRPGWCQASGDSLLRWIYPTSSKPALVEASVRASALDLSGSSHLRVEGLRLSGSASQGVLVRGADVQIRNCQILHPGLVGVSSSGADLVVSGNTITDAGNGAVVTNGARYRILGNTIRRTALLGALGPYGMGDGCCGGRAIELAGDSGIATRNDIDSTGYIGIGFRGRGTQVTENVIARSCMTTDDCGGIYTYIGNYDSSGSMGSSVVRNIVRDPVGAPSGWAHPWDAAQGIYLDDGSHDIRVDSNVCSGNAHGLFLHNNRRIMARANILFGNRTQVELAHDGLAGSGDMIDNQVVGNLLVAQNGQAADIATSVNQAQTAPFGTWTGNTICSDQVLAADCKLNGTVLWEKERVGRSDPRLGPETQRNGGFDSAAIAWSTWPVQVHLAVDSNSACGTGKCLRVRYSGDTATRSPLVNDGTTFATSLGQAWRLSFRAKGLNSGQILTPTFRRSYGDYAALGFSSGVALDTAWTNHVFLFRATVAEALVQLDFHNSKSDSVYWLDDVSLRAVPDSIASLPPSSMLSVNASAAVGSATLDGGPWMDAWGNALPSTLSLAPFQGAVAFRFQGNVSIRPRPSLPNGPRLVQRGEFWELRGLSGPATAFDVRGRILAHLEPDASGTATWGGPRHAGPFWIRTGRVTLTGFETH